jgi:hypothetical protein
MGLFFQRRLAIPVWAVAFSMIALTAPPSATPFPMPPATLLVLTVFGIAAIKFTMSGLIRRLRTSHSVVRVR